MTSLAAWWPEGGEHDAAHEDLLSVYTAFTEGFDTPDLVHARALLDRAAPDQG
jgi:predicted ATPase